MVHTRASLPGGPPWREEGGDRSDGSTSWSRGIEPLDGAGREDVVESSTGEGGKDWRDEVDEVEIRLERRVCFFAAVLPGWPPTVEGSEVGETGESVTV